MTSPITLTVRIVNSYPELGREFIHDEVVTVDAPAAAVMTDPAQLADWAQDQLIEYSGEGPEYADTHGVYEVTIVTAPAGHECLVGQEAYAEG